MFQQPTRKENIATKGKREVLEALIFLPPLSVMVLLRKNIGYRLFRPLGLLTLIMIVSSLKGIVYGSSLYAAGWMILLFGYFQRIQRWVENRRGARQHSYYLGDSVFDKYVPNFFRRRRRMAVFFDPWLCVGIACLLIKYGSPAIGGPLAAWLMISGLMLFAFEVYAYKRETERELDLVDSLVYSEVQGERVEHFSDDDAKKTASQNLPQDAIPTGLGSDIRDKVKQRRNSK